MRGIKIALVMAMALLLAMLPLLGGCAPKEMPKEIIKMGHLGDLTGPTSQGWVPIAEACKNYIEYLNKEKGGINGYPIEYRIIDTAWEVPRTISGYKQLKEWGAVIFVESGTQHALALAEMTARDKIPHTSTTGSAPPLYPPGWAYSAANMMHGDLMVGLDWVLERWTEPRPLRVAVMGWDAPVSRAGLAAFKPYIEKRGAEVVAEEYLSPVTLDTTPQLLRMKAANPDWVFMTWPGSPIASTLAKDARRLGYETNWMGDSGALHHSNIILSREAIQGWHASQWYSQPEDKGWGIDLGKYLWDNYSRFKPGAYHEAWSEYTRGVVWAMIDTEAVRLTLEEVGYENLTGEAVKKYGLDRLNIDTGGLSAEVSYTDYPGDRVAIDKSRVLVVKEDRFVPLTDWLQNPEDARPDYVMKKLK